MDINGAKALKRRLGENRDVQPRPARADVDVSGGAPPVYQWLGVSRPALPGSSSDNDEAATASTSLFQRLGLSSR